MTIPFQIYSKCRLCGRSSGTSDVDAVVDILHEYCETVHGLQPNYDFLDKQCQQHRDSVLSTLQDVKKNWKKRLLNKKRQ